MGFILWESRKAMHMHQEEISCSEGVSSHPLFFHIFYSEKGYGRNGEGGRNPFLQKAGKTGCSII